MLCVVIDKSIEELKEISLSQSNRDKKTEKHRVLTADSKVIVRASYLYNKCPINVIEEWQR